MATIQTQDIISEFCTQEKYAKGLVYVEDVDEFLLYNEETKHYPRLDPSKLEREIFNFVITSGKNYSRGLVKDIEFGLKHMCFRRIEKLKKNYISLNDCVLDVDDLTTVKHSKDIIPYHYLDINKEDLFKETPRWDKYLREVLVDLNGDPDEELITVVGEMLGYYLIPEMKPECLFFLYGGGANGKSKLLNVLEHILGKTYTKYRSLESITGYKFAAADLLGTRLNIIRDDESKYIQADKLKTLVSGESITADRKNKSSVDFQPEAKVVCATNRIPTFSGLDYGLKRRLNFIPFNRRFKPHEKDHFLDEKLQAEIGGILGRFILVGAKRLRENNYVFSPSKQMNTTMMRFEEDVSSAIEFVRECFEPRDGAFITNTDLYVSYDVWCGDNGRKKMSKKNFFKDINDICESETKWIAETRQTKRGRKLYLRPEAF